MFTAYNTHVIFLYYITKTKTKYKHVFEQPSTRVETKHNILVPTSSNCQLLNTEKLF
jgi:hypothetical protein